MSFTYPDTEEKSLYTELWQILTTIVRPSSVVLEVGCGTAEVLHALCKKTGCTGIGSDPFITPRPGNPAFYALKAEETGQIPMDFNVIYGTKSLHHVGDIPAFFRTAIAKLLPGGHLIIADWVAGMDRGFNETYLHPAKVLRMAMDAGFEHLEVRVRAHTHQVLWARKR